MKDDGLDERIKNTANLLKMFAEENLPQAEAEEIKAILGDCDVDENKKDTPK